MQCMEVWGGNQTVDSGVVMAGLDAWVYSRPYGQSTGGGDVYYVSSCATGRIVRLLVADVSGHGSAVADLAVTLRTLMRRFVNHIDQTRFVKSMNEQFTAMSTSGNFATAVVTTFFAPTGALSLCNAGHPPPLLYRSSTKQWCLLPETDGNECASNIPLGIDEEDYQQFDVKLRVGDIVLCYTDSLIESHGADGQMLGTAGLLEVVRSVDAGDPATFTSRLLAKIGELSPKNLDGDDVTVMLFRPNGIGAAVPFKERLAAPFRVIKAIAKAIGSGDVIPWPEMSIPNIGGAMVGALAKVGGRRRIA